MAISKITYKSSPSATPETWMDSTGATAEAADIVAPKTAMLADGVVTEGTGTAPTGGLVLTETYSSNVGGHALDGSWSDVHTALAAGRSVCILMEDSDESDDPRYLRRIITVTECNETIASYASEPNYLVSGISSAGENVQWSSTPDETDPLVRY